MKIVFFGTPEYVIPVLDRLHKKFKHKNGRSSIVAVVTQTPKSAGRKKELTFSAVDSWAHNKGVEKFYDPDDLTNNNIQADFGVLASYGTIIPAQIINHFPHGILNIHPSLLPLWRGASPVQATIISKSHAGATVIKLDNKLDHGPIISQFKDDVLPEDTCESLRGRLFEKSAQVLTTLIPSYLAEKITPRRQDHSKASYAQKLIKDDAYIPPNYLNSACLGTTSKENWKINFINNFTIHPSPDTIHRFIRTMQPWPVAWTEIKIKVGGKLSTRRLKILSAHLDESTKNYQLLALDIVQLEGKNPVPWKQFKEGYNISF